MVTLTKGPSTENGSRVTASTAAIEAASGCRSGENSTNDARATCSSPSAPWMATRTLSSRRNRGWSHSRRSPATNVTRVPSRGRPWVGPSALGVLLEVVVHRVVLQGLAQLGHLGLVDDVDALPVGGAEACERRLQQLDVLGVQAQRQGGRADLGVAEAVVHRQVLGQVADERAELRRVGDDARAQALGDDRLDDVALVLGTV